MYIIYISGIDGCGKTTQATLLKDYLEKKGHSVEYQWLRWEPSIVPAIKKLKKLVSRNKPENQDITGCDYLKTAENSDHAKWSKLKKRLFNSWLFRKLWMYYATRDYYKAYKHASTTWKSDYIIIDRYLIDFYIDQSINFGIDVADFVEKAQNTAISQMEPASLTVLIDIPAEVGHQRKLDGTSQAYLQERRNCYLVIPVNERILRTDGTKDINDIQQSIRSWVEEIITG